MNHILTALESTRDLLCAFRRDHPDKYQPDTDNALREGLSILDIEKSSSVVSDVQQAWAHLESPARTRILSRAPFMFSLLKDWVSGGECFCNTELKARGRCEFCKTHELLSFLETGEVFQEQEIAPPAEKEPPLSYDDSGPTCPGCGVGDGMRHERGCHMIGGWA